MILCGVLDAGYGMRGRGGQERKLLYIRSAYASPCEGSGVTAFAVASLLRRLAEKEGLVKLCFIATRPPMASHLAALVEPVLRTGSHPLFRLRLACPGVVPRRLWSPATLLYAVTGFVPATSCRRLAIRSHLEVACPGVVWSGAVGSGYVALRRDRLRGFALLQTKPGMDAGIRTQDRRFRKPMLYPTELRPHR